MEALTIILVLAIGVIIFFVRGESHQNSIEEKIRSMGGTVINYERRNTFTGLGPFMIVGKGRMVYKIDYDINGQQKEGWVRFGGITGPDWRL